jgi:hypothetical protein
MLRGGEYEFKPLDVMFRGIHAVEWLQGLGFPGFSSCCGTFRTGPLLAELMRNTCGMSICGIV